MSIRKLHNDDIKEALELTWNVFKEFEVPNYSEKGINEFKNFISYDDIINKVQNNQMQLWGHFIDNKIAGVIGIKNNNHICLLFVDKNHHKKGIAKNLFYQVKNECKSYKNITVNSSIFAYDFYHKLGFIDTDNQQESNGIKYTPMVYNF